MREGRWGEREEEQEERVVQKYTLNDKDKEKEESVDRMIVGGEGDKQDG